jgi:hypothetical protein
MSDAVNSTEETQCRALKYAVEVLRSLHFWNFVYQVYDGDALPLLDQVAVFDAGRSWARLRPYTITSRGHQSSR